MCYTFSSEVMTMNLFIYHNNQIQNELLYLFRSMDIEAISLNKNNIQLIINDDENFDIVGIHEMISLDFDSHFSFLIGRKNNLINIIELEKHLLPSLEAQFPSIYTLDELIMHSIIFEKNEIIMDDLITLIDSLDESLIETITKFIECNLNITSTSKAMYVHRNSVQYRIDKIEDATGFNIKEFNSSKIFSLALFLKRKC